ncbi:hypothetical protein GmHk_03G007855 [Glycine max]|nr:hypothetical protein GmHk_03G007855 [Glycine max]
MSGVAILTNQVFNSTKSNVNPTAATLNFRCSDRAERRKQATQMATHNLGVEYLESRAFFTDSYWYWLGLGALELNIWSLNDRM